MKNEFPAATPVPLRHRFSPSFPVIDAGVRGEEKMGTARHCSKDLLRTVSDIITHGTKKIGIKKG